MSFTYNPEARPFYPRNEDVSRTQNSLRERVDELELQLREEKIRNTKLQMVSPEKSKLQLSIREKEKTINELNQSIRSITTSLLSIRCENRDAREKIETLEIENTKILDQLKDKSEEIKRLKEMIEYRLDQLKDKSEEIKRLKETIEYHERNLLEGARSETGKWMGRCLRLDYIFKQLRKIGALPEDHSEWVYDMVDSIEFPDNPNISIYESIPMVIRDENLPHYGDAHMEIPDREEEIELIQRLSMEAHEYSVAIDDSLLECDDLMELKKKSSVKIQAAWRGYKSRVIITYDGIYINSVYNMILNIDKIQGSYNPRQRKFIGNKRCYGLYFFNTSNEPISYQWIDPGKKTGRVFTIRPGTSIKMLTYYGHWFRVWPKYDEKSNYFFRITPNNIFPKIDLVNLRDRVYFDLNTRITIDYDTFISTHSFNLLSVKFNRQIITNGDDEDDDARLQMAIKLSLEGVNNPLTIDVEDYNISQLFN